MSLTTCPNAMRTTKKQKIMIVAGEPSADLHASYVAKHLKIRCPDITLFGMGGNLMEKAGVTLELHIRDSATMGFANVIGALPLFLQKQRHLKRCIHKQRPDALLLVDFAEFNMPLAKFAWRHRVPVVYYIPPKAWAWRAGRAKQLAKWANVIAAIFPFEAEFYQNAGANAEFVGHPLVDFARTPLGPEAAREKLGLEINPTSGVNASPVIGLMPGSRRSEIRHILPPMLKAVVNVASVYPNAQWLLPLAPGISREFLAECRRGIADVPPIHIVENATYPAMRAATLMLVTSGTATLEAACIGTPMIILFRTSSLNWRIIKTLSPLERSGLPNLIARRDIVPELLQTELSPEAITAQTLELLQHPEKREAQRKELLAVYAQLGATGAAERTAQLIFCHSRGVRRR